jgi:hypothetical protein
MTLLYLLAKKRIVCAMHIKHIKHPVTHNATGYFMGPDTMPGVHQVGVRSIYSMGTQRCKTPLKNFQAGQVPGPA